MADSENLRALEEFMLAIESDISDLCIIKRIENRYPFDGVADEILSKAFGLVRSIVILIRNGHPEEAFGLSRSVVECALNLRWITAVQETVQARAFQFVRYGRAVKDFWYWWVKKRFDMRPEADNADIYASQWGLIADTTGAFKHWSGEKQFARVASEVKHPTVASDLSREDLAAKRAIDYFHPSCFVHCSQPGVDNYFSKQAVFEIHRHEIASDNFVDQTLFSCHIYLHELVVYALTGMNVYLPHALPCLERHQFVDEAREFRFLDKNDDKAQA